MPTLRDTYVGVAEAPAAAEAPLPTLLLWPCNVDANMCKLHVLIRFAIIAAIAYVLGVTRYWVSGRRARLGLST